MTGALSHDTTSLTDTVLGFQENLPLLIRKDQFATNRLSSFAVFLLTDSNDGQDFVFGCYLGFSSTCGIQAPGVAFTVILLMVGGVFVLAFDLIFNVIRCDNAWLIKASTIAW